MEYIRVKISDGDITSGQIMTEEQFKDWLTKNDIWKKIRDGLTVTFSKVKRSPLLKCE